MGRGVSLVKIIVKYLPMGVRTQVLDALVLSQLDYCLVIWSSAAEKDLNKLQVAQNKAARCALQCSYRTRVTEMLETLKWLTVRQRSTYILSEILQ